MTSRLGIEIHEAAFFFLRKRHNCEMWVVSVMLIGKAAAHKEFSYFSPHEHREGAIAKIPSRGKEMFGLVLKCAPLTDMRQSVKNANFKLQKITDESRRLCSRQFLRAAFAIADFHACSVGAVISDLTPQAILEAASTMPEMTFVTKADMKDQDGEQKLEELTIIAPRHERNLLYQVEVKKILDKERSAVLITPTIIEAARFAEQLEAICIPCALLHSGLTKKQMRDTWQKIATHKGPLAVVGTPLALSAPRHDVGAFILERAGARSLVRDERPSLSIERCMRSLAQENRADFICGSPAALISEKGQEMLIPPKAEVIDMRPRSTDTPIKKKFEIFSTGARELITSAIESNDRVLLLCARRGFATSTVCDDCGTTLTCERCGSGLVLYDSPRGRVYRCSLCQKEEPATLSCPVCGGWRLSPLGIGVERVKTEAHALFPKASIFFADEKDMTASKKALAIVEKFNASGGLFVGTEGILPYLSEVSTAIVVSADSLLFIPEYTAGEQVLQMLCALRGITTGKLVVQTRAPEHPFIKTLEHGDTNAFLQQEASVRKQFSYPPFATLLRLTLSGPALRMEEECTKLLTVLAPYTPKRLPGRPAARHRAFRRGHMREHILMRIPSDAWPDKKLLALLRSLPLSIEIRVNPRAIFD